mgnify:CR=1 FL=1|jgi:hypothetical protein
MAGNLQLDPSTWDIIVGRGAERVEGLALTAQLVRNRLQTILGEWPPNPELGMPWFDSVFTKAPDISLIQALVTDEIRKVDHVQDVLNIELSLNKDTRILTITFVAQSDWGEFSNNITVGG